MIKPSFTFENNSNLNSNNYGFVDREDAINVFSRKTSECNKEYNILYYYGVGGVGKSTLGNELRRLHKISKNSVVQFYLDLKIEENKIPAEGLFNLACSCDTGKKNKVNFECFKQAYALYCQRKNPSKTVNEARKSIISSSEMGIVLDIISLLGNFGGIMATAAKAIGLAIDKIKGKWIDPTIKEDLKGFDNLPIPEIEKRLPEYFAHDLKCYLNKHPKESILFTIDHFEALNINENEAIHRAGNERWVKDLISHFCSDNYKNCLFLMFGRDPLRWENEWEPYIDQYELPCFNLDWSRKYLENAGIKDEKIIFRIFNSCSGSPLYLYLSALTYKEIIQRNKLPKPEDFGKNYNEIIERFIYNLDSMEVEILKLLAIPNHYSKDIFQYLIKNNNISYPFTKFSEFNRYSFITQSGDHYQLNSLLRNGLLEELDEGTEKATHMAMAKYYESKTMSNSNSIDFMEWVFHLTRTCSKKDFFDWVSTQIKHINKMKDSGEQSILETTINYMIVAYGLQALPFEIVSIYVDIIHLKGAYKESVNLADKYLEQLSFSEIAKDENLAHLYLRTQHHSMFWKPANELLEKLENFMRCLNDASDIVVRSECAILYNNLNVLVGNFDLAKKNIDISFKLAEKCDDSSFKLRIARKKIDLLSFDKDYDGALEYALSLMDINATEYSRYQIYLLGTIGEVYRNKKEIDSAVNLFEKMQKMTDNRNIKGWSAHAHLGLAAAYCQKNEKDQANEHLDKAIKIYTEIEQKWGIINSQIIFSYINGFNEKLLLEVADECKALGYGYYLDFVNNQIYHTPINEFRLLFL